MDGTSFVEHRSAGVRPLESLPACPVETCVQLMGTTVEQLIHSSALQAQGMKLVADRVPSAAAVSLMDLSLEAEAFGCVIRDTNFGAEVELEILVAREQTQAFLEKLTDMTAGTVEAMELGQEYRAFPVE